MVPMLRSFILLALMFASASVALALRPTQKVADRGPKVDLAVMIPAAFAEWREERLSLAQIVDPQQKEFIEKIYSQTLSRTYVNGDGYRIMLSIAYGSDQRDSMQLHKPEVCYPAQGFTVQKQLAGQLVTENGVIHVTRILTSLGSRTEPVTYWTTTGGYVVRGGLQKKLAEMRYGLRGEIPDGMLVRLSSIDGNAERAYEIQGRFAAQMLAAMAPNDRRRVGGSGT
ncbi:MAG: EpsI family protein [Rhodocyclaceae bacterium]|nr:EpsI family protein [Rhodocyclaceae bacterium]